MRNEELIDRLVEIKFAARGMWNEPEIAVVIAGIDKLIEELKKETEND